MKFKNLIFNYWDTLKGYRQKYRYWKLKRRLIKGYKSQIEVDKIMEKWITERILGGQQGRRNELVEKQRKINELEQFVKFLKLI